MTSNVKYRVLGPLMAARGSAPCELGGPRQKMVLAALLANGNRVVSRDALIDAVWSSDPPTAAKASLHSYVSNLRKELGEDQISSEGGGYRIVVDHDSLDARLFESMVDQARSRLPDDPAASLSAFRDALALWYGSPYGDLGWEPALRIEAIRLEELRLVAVEDWIEADLTLGQHERVIGQLQSLVREHPYRERFHAQLMLALYRAGRQVEALRVFEDCRRRFAEELGIDPTPELQQLEQQILEHDPGLAVPGRQPGQLPAQTNAVRGFEVRERIGEGEMGVAYLAFQPSAGRQVVLKQIRDEYANHPQFLQSFDAEAQLIARLEHPHVLSLLDYWRDPDGAYLVTPYSRGSTLADLLRSGGLEIRVALTVLEQVGDALAYAHRQGAVHGNIKPTNVLLDEQGRGYLTDFAIGPRPRDPAGFPMTRSLAYMSPEERRGETPTPKSDIYSFGVLALHSLTGVEPQLPSFEEQLGRLPAHLAGVVARATDDLPAKRQADMEEFLQQLRRANGITVSDGARQKSPVGVRNPYRGLHAFTEADAIDFHGRDTLTGQLVGAVGSSRLVAVVGPSGIGKSSVVRAGLVPALRAGGLPSSDQWLITEMLPGSHPFEELELALRRVAVHHPANLIEQLVSDDTGLLRAARQILPPDSQLVLVIDQFEELFSVNIQEATRRLFIEGLVRAVRDEATGLRVILTLRADFFDLPLRYQEFADLLTDGLVTVRQPSPQELFEAITNPASGVGIGLEDGLVEQIIRDVEEQPGGLPLLQFSLTELFAKRQGNLLTAEGYKETGGVLGALGGRAEELYDQLQPSGKQAARQLFLRLVDVHEGGDATRRRVRRAELNELPVDQPALETVLSQFGAHRFLTFDRDPVSRGPTVEIAHEAMLRQWGRLTEWVNARQQDLIQHQRLRMSTQEWADSDKDPSFLLRGRHLGQLEAWAAETPIVLTSHESEYLTASRGLRDAELATTRGRRRLLLGSLVAGLVVTTTLAGIALGQKSAAERQTRITTARELAAQSALALEEDPDLAILLALEAADVTMASGEPVLPEAVGALQRAVQTSRAEFRLDDGSIFVKASPDGSLLATDSVEPGTMVIWDARSGSRLFTLPSVGESVGGAAFSPVDDMLAVAYEYPSPENQGPAVVVWSGSTGAELFRLTGPDPVNQRPVFSPDGRSVAAASTSANSDSRVTVWDLSEGSIRSSFQVEGGAFEVQFARDGSSLLVTEPVAQRVGFYSPDTGELFDSLVTPGFSPWSQALDPAGQRLALADDEDRMQMWDLERMELRFMVEGPGNPITWSLDGRTLATGGAGGAVFLVDPATGDVRMTLRGHTSRMLGVNFIPPGDQLASVAFGGETIVSNVAPAGPDELGAIAIGSGTPFSWQFARDGAEMLVSTHEGTVEQVDVASGRRMALLTDQLGAISGQFGPKISPDLRYVASLTPDGGSSVRVVPSFEVVSELPPCVTPMAFGPEGTLLAVDGRLACTADGGTPPLFTAPASADLRSRVIDLTTREVVVDMGEKMVHAAVFSPDGRYLATIATSGADLLFEIYDVGTGALLAALDRVALVATFAPDGDLLAWGSVTGKAGIINLAALAQGTDPEHAIVFAQSAHFGQVTGIALNGRGTLATAGAGDQLVRLWDITSGEVVGEFGTDRAPGRRAYVAFSPDGSYLSYSDASGVIRRYTLDVDSLIDLATRRLTRSMTPDECLRFLEPSTCP